MRRQEEEQRLKEEKEAEQRQLEEKQQQEEAEAMKEVSMSLLLEPVILVQLTREKHSDPIL